MKKTTLYFAALCALLIPALSANAATFEQRVAGRILLQVQSRGEAWYVNPVDQRRYFLGRPADAFRVMKELGLGISNADFDRYKNNVPARLQGRILIKVHDRGQAYYANPTTKKLVSLGRPEDAYKVMRETGLGITNADLYRIPAEPNHTQPDIFRHTVTVDADSATPAAIRVPAGSTLNLRIRVANVAMPRGGVYFVGSGGMGQTGEIRVGGAHDMTIKVTKSYTYTPFLVGTTIRLPYDIRIDAE